MRKQNLFGICMPLFLVLLMLPVHAVTTKETISKWFTLSATTPGVLDYLVFFTLFMALCWFGLSKLGSDDGKDRGALIALSAALALALTIGLIVGGKMTLAKMLHFSYIFLYILFLVLLFKIFESLFGASKDDAPFWKKLLAFLLAALLAGLILVMLSQYFCGLSADSVWCKACGGGKDVSGNSCGLFQDCTPCSTKNCEDPAVSCSISSNQLIVQPGESATLQFEAKGKYTKTRLNGVNISSGSSLAVTPTKTTTYVGEVESAKGVISCMLTITVMGDPAKAPTCTMTATPAKVRPNEKSRVRIEMFGGASEIYYQNTYVRNKYYWDESPLKTTTFTGKVKNAFGENTCSVQVIVDDSLPPAGICKVEPAWWGFPVHIGGFCSNFPWMILFIFWPIWIYRRVRRRNRARTLQEHRSEDLDTFDEILLFITQAEEQKKKTVQKIKEIQEQIRKLSAEEKLLFQEKVRDIAYLHDPSSPEAQAYFTASEKINDIIKAYLELLALLLELEEYELTLQKILPLLREKLVICRMTEEQSELLNRLIVLLLEDIRRILELTILIEEGIEQHTLEGGWLGSGIWAVLGMKHREKKTGKVYAQYDTWWKKFNAPVGLRHNWRSRGTRIFFEHKDKEATSDTFEPRPGVLKLSLFELSPDEKKKLESKKAGFILRMKGALSRRWPSGRIELFDEVRKVSQHLFEKIAEDSIALDTLFETMSNQSAHLAQLRKVLEESRKRQLLKVSIVTPRDVILTKQEFENMLSSRVDFVAQIVGGCPPLTYAWGIGAEIKLLSPTKTVESVGAPEFIVEKFTGGFSQLLPDPAVLESGKYYRKEGSSLVLPLFITVRDRIDQQAQSIITIRIKDSPKEYNVISGTVIDKETKKPVAGAQVWVTHVREDNKYTERDKVKVVTTHTDGTFAISGIFHERILVYAELDYRKGHHMLMHGSPKRFIEFKELGLREDNVVVPLEMKRTKVTIPKSPKIQLIIDNKTLFTDWINQYAKSGPVWSSVGARAFIKELQQQALRTQATSNNAETTTRPTVPLFRYVYGNGAVLDGKRLGHVSKNRSLPLGERTKGYTEDRFMDQILRGYGQAALNIAQDCEKKAEFFRDLLEICEQSIIACNNLRSGYPQFIGELDKICSFFIALKTYITSQKLEQFFSDHAALARSNLSSGENYLKARKALADIMVRWRERNDLDWDQQGIEMENACNAILIQTIQDLLLGSVVALTGFIDLFNQQRTVYQQTEQRLKDEGVHIELLSFDHIKGKGVKK